MTELTKTFEVRAGDKHANVLCRQAAAVNRVRNFVNELSHLSIRERRPFLSVFDFHPYTKKVGTPFQKAG